jgi:signal transduction histidine kinase
MAGGARTGRCAWPSASIAALACLLAACAPPRESGPVAHARAYAYCQGPLEACEAEGASFRELRDSATLTNLVPKGGADPREALTLAYRLPGGDAFYLEGSANRQRARLVRGVASVQDGGLAFARSEAVLRGEGLFLVEVTMGAHRGLFGKEILGGNAEAIAFFLDRHLVAPLLLAGWLALACAQQIFSRRNEAQRVGSRALAFLTGASALRILSLQNGWSTLWLDTGDLRRSLELVTAPAMGIGAGVFYHWLAGASLRTPRFLSWLAMALGCVVVALLGVPYPTLRPYAVPLIMVLGVWGLVVCIEALRGGWARIERGERQLVLAGASAVAVGAVGDIVTTRLDWSFLFDIGAMPIGLIVETSCQAMILARRNARAHAEVLRLEQVAREASERALAEQERVTSEIRRLDRLKDEFLANTSHELRTPLHCILGLSEAVLAAEPSLSAMSRERLEVVVASGQRLTTLVNDLLDFSKLHHRAIELQPSRVDLRGAVKLAIAVVAPLAEISELAVANAIPLGLFVHADENRLQQVLANLLGNAVKFTERGRVVVHAERAGARVIISVEDTGVGIAPDLRERIFESFEQGDGSTVRTYGGTGLGLAVTKKLVELHGGRITVRSELGVGSAFVFDLPVSDDVA